MASGEPGVTVVLALGAVEEDINISYVAVTLLFRPKGGTIARVPPLRPNPATATDVS